MAISFFEENYYEHTCYGLFISRSFKGNVKWTKRAIAQRETIYLAIPKDWAAAHSIMRYTEVDIFAMGDGTLEDLQGFVRELQLLLAGTLAVSVTATNGITFYLLTPSQYSSDVSSGSWGTYSLTSEHISSGSFNTNIESGTWYAVYYNSNIITKSTITISTMTFTT